VDLNYNNRSHGELYVVEAKEAMQFASFMGSKVLAEWQAMVGEIHTCQDHSQNLTAEQAEEEQGNLLYQMKYKTIQAIAGLHKVCLADLQLAKSQLKNTGA
jgi:hypothetical protein